MFTRTFTPLARIVATIALSLLLLPPAATRAATNGILVTIEGTKQGKFKSDDKSGKIAVVAFTREAKSPRDAATGQASGKLQNLPVTITKSIDAASPQFLQALATNEVLKNVTIEFYAPTPDGVQALAQTIKLTNASVAGLRQYQDGAGDDAHTAGGDLDLREDVSFSYQTLEFVGDGSPLTEKPSTPAKPLDPSTPSAGAAPTAGAAPAPAPAITRAPRLTPVPTLSPRMSPADAATATPAPSVSPAPAPAPTATTTPTLTRAQRIRRAAAAAAAATAPTSAPAPSPEAQPAPATKPAAEQPIAPAPAPRKRR